MATVISTLLGFVQNLFGKRQTQTPQKATSSNQRPRDSGPGFGMVAFVYRHITDKERLPLVDRTPLGYWVGQQGDYMFFINLHWMMGNPKALLALQRFRQNGQVLNSKTLKEKSMAQMISLALSNQPESAFRKYKLSGVSHWYRLSQEEEAEAFKHFPAQIRKNQLSRRTP
jgi:hypothetical protein